MHIAMLCTVVSSTAEAHTSVSGFVSMARQYSGRLIDNPLWLGLTLLAGIVFAAGVIVYVRRRTSKLLRQWTCDVTSGCFCCCCRRCIRQTTSGDVSASSNDIG